MNSLYGRNGRKTLLGGLLTVLMAALALAPVGVAQAGGGGSMFEWCPSPLTHGSLDCYVGTGVQDVVNAAQSDHKPGHVFINAGTFTENVTATGLRDVSFVGNANGLTGTTISGSLAINKSRNITVTDFMVIGGLSVEKGSGAYKFTGNNGVLSINNSKFDHNTAGNGLEIMQDGHVGLVNVSASKNTGVGIIVGASGNILLMDVSANKNGLLGCNLVGSGGHITVTTSKSKMNHFDGNGLVGLVASTSDTIELTDISASKNGQDGLRATSSSAVALNTSKSKMNKFDRNAGDGVYISTTGAIILYDVSASGNGGNGLNLGTTASLIAIQPIQSKALHFDKNAGHGVDAGSDGAVMLTDVMAGSNGGDGVHLGSGTSITVQTHLSRLNRLEKNGGYGITATTSGYVELYDVSASRNVSGGAFVGSGAYTVITLLHARMNLFDKNLGHGLTISAGGGISMLDISASGNHLDGAHLGSGQSVNVVTSFDTNKFDKNGGSGIFLSAGNTVLIQNTSASKNQVYGLDLTTTDDKATVTCSVVKNNIVHDIRAALGTANLFLNSITMTHPGQVDVTFAGTGVMMIDSPACP